jgi:DNA adenine methylase
MNNIAKSPLRYPGGKSRAVSQILAHFPVRIGEFREPFVGGASVFFAVKSLFGQHISRYWINDIYGDLVYFWYWVQHDVEKLIATIEVLKKHYPDGTLLYRYLKDESNIYNDFDRAVRFFIMNRITFSGVMDAGGYSQQAFEARFTPSSIQRVQQIAPLLKKVQITQGDYEALLFTEGQDVLIFLDPPYWSATQSRLYGKRGELHTSFDHERFASNMRHCTYRWLITYDDSPKIRDLFAFANISTWELQYGMNNYKQGKADKGKELFIKNF